VGGIVKVELICLETSDTFRLDRFPVVIGTAQEAEVHLDDPAVAPYQCMLDRTDDMVVLWDLKTGHGTLVNDVPITRASLTPGDKLTLGRTDLVVLFDQTNRPDGFVRPREEATTGPAP
jgi:pSer/pThr/pTyr-binding forkhead associated (FHA) protein